MAHSQHSHSDPDASAPWTETIALVALEASQELMLGLDSSGVVRYANPAALRALHSDPAQLLGTRFIELLDPGSRSKGQRLLDQASATPTSEFELNQIAADGQVVMISYRAVLLPAADAAPGCLVIGRPLAATVATTERLIALNRRLSALFTIAAAASRSLLLADLLSQALDVALAELELAAGAIFLQDSAADQPQLRLAVQQGFTAAFSARLSEPEEVGRLWQHAQDGLEATLSGSPEELGLQPDDLPSTVGPLLSSATVALTSEGQLIGWLYVVSDRYRALQGDEYDLLRTIGNLLGTPVANARLHDELIQTSGRLQAVLGSIDSGVLLVDQDNIVRYANTRLGALLNVSVTDWPGQPRAAVMPSTLTRSSQHSALLGDLWDLNGTSPRILRRFAEPVQDVTGAPLGAIEVYRDVTQLQQMDQLKDEFVAAAAHDLKTPVTAVKGYAQIALRLARRLDDERLSQQLAMINARSDELTLLMDALLDMSRIQAGRMVLDLDTIDVGGLVGTVLNHFEFDLRRRKREVRVALPEQPLEVVWDPLRMQGVLVNLIGNALKYSPEGGPIVLEVQPRGADQRLIELTVTDHGIGIPPEERALIFDRFYRVRATIEHGFKGTGIGLYIARHVVELHGGRIWAGDALHGGSGTTMHVELPRVASPPDA